MHTNRRAFLDHAAISVLVLYRNTLSHSLLHSCRFFPSCSQYAIEAIRRYGVWRGGVRAAWRVLRCHPFGGWGADPVR